MKAAIAKGHFTSSSHNMCESDKDSNQDLNFWIRSLGEVLRETLGDNLCVEGHQHFSFEMIVN